MHPVVLLTTILYMLVMLGQCLSLRRSWHKLKKETQQNPSKRIWKGLTWNDRFSSITVLKLFYTVLHLIALVNSFIDMLLYYNITETLYTQLKPLLESSDAYSVAAEQYFAPEDFEIRQPLLVAQGFKQIAGFFVIGVFHTYTYYGPIKRYRAMQMFINYRQIWNQVFDWVPRIVYSGILITYAVAISTICIASVTPDAQSWITVYSISTYNPLFLLYVVYTILVSLVLNFLFLIHLKRYIAFARDKLDIHTTTAHQTHVAVTQRNVSVPAIPTVSTSTTPNSNLALPENHGPTNEVQDLDRAMPSTTISRNSSTQKARNAIDQEKQDIKDLASTNGMLMVFATFGSILVLGILYILGSIIPMSYIYKELFNLLAHMSIAVQLYVTEFYLEQVQKLWKLVFRNGGITSSHQQAAN